MATPWELAIKVSRKKLDIGGTFPGLSHRYGAHRVRVVYKVDRLSRSLLDFARMMETFDKHQVAFVSVTQQFNTASSMGRLILNVAGSSPANAISTTEPRTAVIRPRPRSVTTAFP